MSLPPNQIQEAQGAPGRRGALGAAMSYWMKEPYYMAKWNYFHRPSVWNAVGGSKGVQWHGMYGFKSLLAGSGGISYTGGPRSVAPGMKWLLRGGGRGLEQRGLGFSGLDPNVGRAALRIRGGISAGLPRGYSTNITSVPGLTGRVGMGFQRAGAGFRTGGVTGAIRGIGGRGTETAATWIGKIGGGYSTGIGAFTYRGMEAAISRGGGLTEMAPGLRASIARGITSEVSGVGGLVRPGKYSGRVLGTLSPVHQQLFSMTGKGGRSALRRGIMARGGARLMAAGAVGLNLALFGGMVGNLAMGATRAIGEASWRMRMNTRIPALEFGGGVDPFQQQGSMTERQRAIQAIQGSHLNARTAMGNEARLLHQ